MTDDDEFPPVRLTCAVCSEAVVRSSLDGKWVHADEFVHLKTLKNDFDHEAVIDVIDVGEDPEPRPRAQRNFPDDPFSPIHFS